MKILAPLLHPPRLSISSPPPSPPSGCIINGGEGKKSQDKLKVFKNNLSEGGREKRQVNKKSKEF